MKRSSLRSGQFVMLRASKKEGWKAEPAQIISFGRTTVVVEVASLDPTDDGQREVAYDQITRRATMADLQKAEWDIRHNR